MKRLYTLALSALVLAASATVAVPTARMAKAKVAEAIPERVESRNGLAKVSPQRTIAAPVSQIGEMARKRAVNVNKFDKIMTWNEVRKNFASEQVLAKSNDKMAAKVAKVKAKAPMAAPASIDELVAQKWEATYEGMLNNNAGSHSGEASFAYYADYKELDLVLPDYSTSLYCGYENGNLVIYPAVDYGTNSQGYKISLQPINATDGAMLNLTEPILVPFNEETGAFDFPADFAWALLALNPNTGAMAGYFWAASTFTLSVSEGDFSVTVSTPEVCNAENKFTFTVALGEDVAKAKYMVMPVDASAADLIQYINSMGAECVAGQTYTVDPTVETAAGPITKSGYASVLFASYDAEGNVKKTAQQAFIVVLEGTEGWKNVGEIDYVDQLFAQYYNNFSHTQKAMLQAKEGQPGLYRIVEPYSERAGLHSATCGHHFFMLNIADPEWVEVPFSVSGLDLAGDGILSFGTCAALGYTKETAQAGMTSGKLVGQTVTFPVKSFYAHEQYYNKPGSWSYFNAKSEVTFTFPDINLNLTVVDADKAPVEGATVTLGEVSATTDAEGKATVKVPFETGYFATVKPVINDTEVEITLTGAETDYTHTIAAVVTPEPVSVAILPTDFAVASPTAEALKDGFTALAEKSTGATAPAYNSTANAIRLYADNTLTISGKQVTKVVFDIDAKNNAKRYTTFTPSTGALSAVQAAGDTQITWAGDAESVTFTVGKTAVYGTESEKAGQIHITKITVYGLPGSAEPQVYEVANIGEFLTGADKAHNTTITGEVTVTYQNGKYLFITDATGSMEVYGSLDKTYANGMKLTGIAGKYDVYNGMPQMVPQVDSFTDGTAGDEVAPKETTLAEVALGEYVVVKGLNIVADGDNFNVTDGTTTKQLYNRFGLENIEAAENVTITGIGSVFGETQQLFPISIVADGETPGPDPEPETWTLLEGKGVYAASTMATMFGGTTEPVEVDVYESDQHKGVYKFVGVWPDLGEGLELVIDATDPDYVKVPEQSTGYVDEVDGITYIASFTALFEQSEVEAQAPELIITMKDGYINIPADALVLRWPEAPANSQYETDPEEWYMAKNCPAGYALLPGGTMPDPNEGWKTLGDATLMDGWVTSLFDDQTDASMWYTVELQQNEKNENLYRLVDPYHNENFIGLQYNQCTGVGYIQFDVTDPEHVVFATDVAAGFGNAELGFSNIYCTNILGMFMAYGYDIETLVAMLGDEIPYTTFKDGVISLDRFVSVDPETGAESLESDATFGISPDDAGYGWKEEDGSSVDMTARIWFPGVTPSYEQDGIREITAEDGADKVYNLRGQRVGKVMTPGIYIINNRKVVVK